MTQEDKTLLLKDLCARLPYGVKALTPWKKDGPGPVTLIDITSSKQVRVFEDWYDIEEIKPYLRPMSSMTEEEEIYYNTIYTTLKFYEKEDWLNTHHFDYRGLIEKGLALEATEGMYKTE